MNNKNNNINIVLKENLCIECGICRAICPQNCIDVQKKNYNYQPHISSKCIDCGLCLKTCPVNNLKSYDSNKSVEQNILGGYKKIYSIKTKDKNLLQNATSGGVVTEIVRNLLKQDEYDCAFLVEGYSYNTQLETKYFDKNMDLSETQKSRYLTVSHFNSCKYILNNPDKKVILIGTGCTISGISNFIKLKNLNRNNYLLIGLFCDKTMNYGVVEYFRQHPESRNKKLKNLFFRTKLAGGWPGNVRIEYTNGDILDLPNTERMKLKDFFILERCLYCLDKFNKNSDISLGDNYIENNKDIEGLSSVIVRSDIGANIISKLANNFEIREEREKDLILSQKLHNKDTNVGFLKIKKIIDGKPSRKIKKTYKKQLKKIRITYSPNLYKTINSFIEKSQKSKSKVFWEYIFSIKNSDNRKFKIITLFGLKIKIKRNKK